MAAVLVGATAPVRADDVVELSNVEDVESFSLADLLERPVNSASGYASRPADSPTIVSTVDHEAIQAFGYRNMAQVLAGMRGIYVSSDRNYSYLGSRGLSVPGDYNTRYALSIDSHHVNDPTYGQALVGPELGLPMLAIERVELVRGGAWSVHGEQALLGAVQVVTASGATRPGLQVRSTSRFTAETFEDPADRPAIAPHGEDIEASYGTVRSGVDVFVAGSYSRDPGLRALYMPELAAQTGCVTRFGRARACDGVVIGDDGEEWGGGFAAVKYGRWALRVMAARRTKEVSTAAFETIVGLPIQTTDDRAWADLQYKRETARTDVFARVAGDYAYYEGHYEFLDETATHYTAYEDSRGLALSGELKGRYKWAQLGEHITDAEVAIGSEVRAAQAKQFATALYADSQIVSLDRRDPMRVISLFGHASARLFGRVVAFAALRNDDHLDQFGRVTSPQAGLVLDAGTLGRLRVIVSRGYRAPTPYETFYSVSAGLPPADLDPEISTTREVSLERYIGEHLRLFLVGFHQNVDGLIGITDMGNGFYENRGGGAVAYGLESELEGHWERIALRASYSQQRTKTLDGTEPANAPRSLAKLSLIAPIAKGRADVACESYYVAKRLSYNGAEVPPQFTTNLALTVHDIVQRLDGQLGISNVFDDRTGDPSGEEHAQAMIPRDPRTVWLRLSVRLDP